VSKTANIPIVLLPALALVLAACSFGPPPSCGDDIGGTADTAAFDQHFSSMELVSQTTGQAGEPSDPGVSFPQDEPIQILLDAKAEVAIRTCIQPMGGQAKSPVDSTAGVGAGKQAIDLGSFDSGSYVIRVIVDGVLVKNLPFSID
jgi:hypothetical protein